MSTTLSREQISAVFDGEWTDASGDAADALRMVSADAEARADWLLYAQIGDSLRMPDLRLLPEEASFLARVSAAIEREPVVIAPTSAQSVRQAVAHRRPHWSTRIAAGMAAVAGVAVMAWVALPTLQQQNGGSGGQVAATTGAAQQVAAVQPVSMQVPVAAVAPSQQVAVVQADLQVPVAGGGAQGVAAMRPVAVGADLPMAEYLLAHQQMAGGMMPSVPAILRQPLAQAPAAHP